MILDALYWAVIITVGFSALTTILIIGKERSPYTPVSAAAAVAVDAVVIVVLLLKAGAS